MSRMSDVNWDSVNAPSGGKEPEHKGSPLGTVAFIVFVLVLLIVGGGYVNVVMLGERVRDIVTNDCPDPTCAVDVQTRHDDCYSASVSYGVPSLADFQTPPTSPKLGIGTVDLTAYRQCVFPAQPKTLADEKP